MNQAMSNEQQDLDFEGDEQSNPFLSALLNDGPMENDRYLINFIKGVMSQERAVKSDMIKVLKEQVMVLRQELIYKQSIIDSLLLHYNKPCTHGGKSHNNNNNNNTPATPTDFNPYSNNRVNLNHPPIRFEEDPIKKPAITLYSTSSPFNSPRNCRDSVNDVNREVNCVSGGLPSDTIGSAINGIVNERQTNSSSTMATDINNNNNNNNDGNCHSYQNGINENEIQNDVANWNLREANLQADITAKQPSKNEKPEKIAIKPLSETLLSVRNLIKSNVSNDVTGATPLPSAMNGEWGNNKHKEGLLTAKDEVVTTQKTFRVKFNRNGGSHVKAKKND